MEKRKWIIMTILLAGGAWRAGCQSVSTTSGDQTMRRGPAANRPARCVAGQTWLATDTGALSYCAVSGSPGTWRTLSTGGGASSLCNVTLSASPIFDATSCGVFTLTLGATAVTSSSLVNAQAGQELTFMISQDATGGRAFAWPPNVTHVCAISSSPGVSTIVTAVYDGTNANATDCTTTDIATLISGPTRSEPASPSSGLSCWFDALAGGSGTLKCKDAGGNVRAAVLTASAATAQQYVTYVDSNGVPQTATVSDAALSLSDVTNNNASAARHGFLPKLPGDNTKCLLGDGTYGPCGFTMSGAGAYSPFQGMTAIPAAGPGDVFASSGSNGSMECYQWIVPFGIKLGDLFTISGGGGGSGDVLAFAVYQDSGSNTVGAKVANTDVALVGNTAVQYREVPWGGTHPVLSAGAYWMCWSASNATGMWKTEPTWGSGYAGAVSGALNVPRRVKCSNTVTYSGSSTTLPSSCTTPTAVTSTSNPPYVVIAQ